MMSKIDEVRSAMMAAMKAKDKDARAVYSVVISRYQLQEVEAKASGKTIGDTELLSIIQKVLKELNDEKEGYTKVGNAEKVLAIENQIKELEDKNVIFMDTDSALKKHPELFNKYFNNLVKYDENKYTALNGALWSGGSFIIALPPIKRQGDG